MTEKGMGWSFGVPGFRVGFRAGGGITLTIGIPGTGLCFTKVVRR